MKIPDWLGTLLVIGCGLAILGMTTGCSNRPLIRKLDAIADDLDAARKRPCYSMEAGAFKAGLDLRGVTEELRASRTFHGYGNLTPTEREERDAQLKKGTEDLAREIEKVNADIWQLVGEMARELKERR